MKALLFAIPLVLLAACGPRTTQAPPPMRGAQGQPPQAQPPQAQPPPSPSPAPSLAPELAPLPGGETEGMPVDAHLHLDVFVNRQPVAVPAEIGIDPSTHRLTPVHTHDDSGVIHVVSPVPRDFTLGQFFAEWHRPLGDPRVYLDGKPYAAGASALVLRNDQEIAVVYGPAPDRIPGDYAYNEGG